jgi:two-component system sensor histidine kinase/response regulator
MPEMDGFDLIEKIRSIPEFVALPVLILSSGAQRGEREHSRKLGATYLTKPIQPSELLDAILSVLSVRTDSPKEADRSSSSPMEERQTMKVLLAEDNAVNRTLAMRLLEKHGHTVVVAENGRQAIEALERETIDLVLMDVQMPEMDGLEATAAIREREKTTGAHMPIIALTAHAMKGDRERCLAAGADDYLTKPVRSAELFEAVDRVKNAKRNSPIATVSKEEDPPTHAFDSSAALKHVEGDGELLDEIVHIFAEECPNRMSEIENAIHARDLRQLERAAHSLRGSASNICATEVVRAAAELEERARTENLSNMDSQVRSLESAVKQLLNELECFSRKVTK